MIPSEKKALRILCCTRLSRMGASSRYRTIQYFPYLQKHGFEIDLFPLLDDAYLQLRYSKGRRAAWRSIMSYLRRWKQLRQLSDYDLLWLEKEAFPWIPQWIEVMAISRTVPYVVDYDDAEFHRYDTHWFTPVRALLGKKIDWVMRNATIVIAGNDYIAERAYRAGAAWVERLPTVVDLDRYPLTPPPRNTKFTIGWIGTPITARFLHTIQPVLEEICRRRPARLVTIGSGPLTLPGVPVEVRPWSEDTEVRQMQDFDVGIMPLDDSPNSRGKCGLKLIQYMACGRPVVGTPVGVNAEIIQHGVNGFQANTPQEWVAALETLHVDADLRSRMGLAGRELVEQHYSLSVVAPLLAQLLHAAVTTSHSAAA